MARKRDYRAEYKRRVDRGLSRGLTRSQARGHARSGEATDRVSSLSPKATNRLRRGVKSFLKSGNLTRAAKASGVSAERLRRHVHDQKLAARQRGRLKPIVREMAVFSRGRELTVRLNFDEASKAGTYLNAVGKLLRTNDVEALAAFHGDGIIDLSGKRHPFEVDPNVLYELSFSGQGTFENVYRITVL